MTAIQEILQASELDAVFALLRERTDQDFSGYKIPPVLCRLQRRIAQLGLSTVGEYVRVLTENPAEIDALHADLLIGVTAFFRDHEAWDALSFALDQFLLAHRPGTTLRGWVPGCGTGEEAYSMAMLLIERVRALGAECDVQLFATDMDRQALAVARAGVYPDELLGGVSPERLRTFFSDNNGSHRIASDVRDKVVFALHDVVADVPFSLLDLVSCRNVLIYLDAKSKRRVFDLLRYALKPEGLLFLGAAESAPETLFSAVDEGSRVYNKGVSAPHAQALSSLLRPCRPVQLSRAVEGTLHDDDLKAAEECLLTATRAFGIIDDAMRAHSASSEQELARLSEINSDLENVLRGEALAIVVLGADLRIRRMSALASKWLALRPEDAGRPLTEAWPAARALLEDTELVASSLRASQRIVPSPQGREYRAVLRPYRTSDNLVDGFLLTLRLAQIDAGVN